MASLAIASSHRRVAEINITPLVDVMLVLLVIFMVTAPLLSQPIPMDLPGQAPVVPTKPNTPIRLRVDAAGQLYWNQDSIQVSALQGLLQAEVARDTQNSPTLQIDASGDADYGVVARVLAAARNAQVQRIGFVGG